MCPIIGNSVRNMDFYGVVARNVSMREIHQYGAYNSIVNTGEGARFNLSKFVKSYRTHYSTTTFLYGAVPVYSDAGEFLVWIINDTRELSMSPEEMFGTSLSTNILRPSARYSAEFYPMIKEACDDMAIGEECSKISNIFSQTNIDEMLEYNKKVLCWTVFAYCHVAFISMVTSIVFVIWNIRKSRQDVKYANIIDEMDMEEEL